jgi:hypothetical protein
MDLRRPVLDDVALGLFRLDNEIRIEELDGSEDVVGFRDERPSPNAARWSILSMKTCGTGIGYQNPGESKMFFNAVLHFNDMKK